ncbi:MULTISPECIES: formylglycine-generating enzyme family protein [unclassified Paenibacillus]|uniref:formylglycine-generating enzyme family protein n=1 Tax=unclassified Paenibacillus TaxID=185978 RepID=UPI0009A6B8F4|nr:MULTISPECIES: SUMF1/EgtB/PvdO family nonheme iron enzyme [unclassified Paenibacillus]SLK09852.1 Formylglycine-generating enzyme, required for sulfatase activity, contains SUMF1/FGE domain [Paenibacillus sp. RU5A]SOC71757.1 Formylglycine-generating enzyme, required for sulfatase activity, contains SUMF1/FGE domain [Paenibacillus sp. RU26A]SOC74113.1 Formylglycine-generating enzyme, required for sulfatase activity, contains SUMF1/FGE domain [Paenibacillus sp. RU5M]
MRKLLMFFLIAIMVVMSACSQDKPEPEDNLVFVQGGTFKNNKSNFAGRNATLSNFYIGKYEVTQKEWEDVMGNNPSGFKGDQLPVEMVSWYDAVEYCNQRSIQEGLKPHYNIDKDTQDQNNKNDNDNIKWTVTINEGTNGYRLPTEAEWEYAASGGQESKNYTYSGSNNADKVAWYWKNAGDKILTGDWNWPAIESNKTKTKSIGTQQPNELGIYDMSGNVREWCWDWYSDAESQIASFRVIKGGGWIGGVNNNEIAFRGKFDANGFGPDQGFRVVRGE